MEDVNREKPFTSAKAILLGIVGLLLLSGMVSCGSKATPASQTMEPTEDITHITSVEDLRNVTFTGTVDEVIAALNDVKRLQHRKDLIGFVESLWTKDASLGTEFPWAKLDGDPVRVHVADVMLQAAANDFVAIDTAPILEYVRGLVASDDKSVAMAAVSALSASTDPRDVELLATAANDSRDGVFRAAVLSLAFMCSDKAGEALSQLAERTIDNERRRYVLDTREKARSHKEKAGACPKG